MSVAAVRLAALTVELDGRRVLGPLELTVAPGEHVLVVGPSGSGKTTLLRAVAGLARPSAGEVALFGVPASRAARLLVPPRERGIGMVFQGGALWPHMSAARTLEFVLARRGVARRARAALAAELLERVGLAGYESRRPGTLSGGEAQRLALARALAGEPRLLLLDEPLGPLDGPLRTAMLALVREIAAARSLTVIHVTHDPGEVHPARTIHLREGRLIADEPE